MARYYAPDLGRFISEDPAEDGLNWYVYCGNNPLAFVDPTGLWQAEGAINPESDDDNSTKPPTPDDSTTPSGPPKTPTPPETQQTITDLLKSIRDAIAKIVNPEDLKRATNKDYGKDCLQLAEMAYKSGNKADALAYLLSAIVEAPMDALNSVIVKESGVDLLGAVNNLARSMWGESGAINVGPVGFAKDLLKYASNVKPLPGVTDVYAHATPDTFLVLNDGKWATLSHRDMANFLKSQGVSDDLRLISCGAGQGRLAQDLANKVGTNVIAASDTVWIFPNGSLTVGPYPTANSGTWRLFKPGN